LPSLTLFPKTKEMILKHVWLNRHNQEGMSAEQCSTSFNISADNCAYGDLKDDLIRNCIVVGVSGKVLSERLQLDPELTLEKAKKIF